MKSAYMQCPLHGKLSESSLDRIYHSRDQLESYLFLEYTYFRGNTERHEDSYTRSSASFQCIS